MMNFIYHILLWFITIVFLGRVLAQVFVGIYSPSYLPKMEMWYSGLMPYPILLTYQVFIYTCMIIFNFCLYMERGPLFLVLNDKTSIYYIYFGAVYFLLMILRFVIHKIKEPDIIWPRGSIPIFFHFFLAIYIILLGSYSYFDVVIIP